ncbi:hypothetical protein D3C81_1584520 [compost metagenome]
MRNELQVIRTCLQRHQSITGADFTAAVFQAQGRGFGIAASHLGHGADVDLCQLVAEEAALAVIGDVVLPEIAPAGSGVAAYIQVIAGPGLAVAHGRAHHEVTLARLSVLQAEDIGLMAGAGAQAVVFQADDVRQLLEAVHDGQVLQERFDIRQRDGVDRCLLTRARLGGHAVQIGKAQHVTRID